MAQMLREPDERPEWAIEFGPDTTLSDAIDDLEAVAGELELKFVTYSQAEFVWD